MAKHGGSHPDDGGPATHEPPIPPGSVCQRRGCRRTPDHWEDRVPVCSSPACVASHHAQLSGLQPGDCECYWEGGVRLGPPEEGCSVHGKCSCLTQATDEGLEVTKWEPNCPVHPIPPANVIQQANTDWTKVEYTVGWDTLWRIHRTVIGPDAKDLAKLSDEQKKDALGAAARAYEEFRAVLPIDALKALYSNMAQQHYRGFRFRASVDSTPHGFEVLSHTLRRHGYALRRVDPLLFELYHDYTGAKVQGFLEKLLGLCQEHGVYLQSYGPTVAFYGFSDLINKKENALPMATDLQLIKDTFGRMGYKVTYNNQVVSV